MTPGESKCGKYPESFRGKLIPPRRDERIFFIRHALRAGFTIEEIFNLTKI